MRSAPAAGPRACRPRSRYAIGMSEASACDVCATPETSDVFGIPLCAECERDPSRVDGLHVTIEHKETKEVLQISVADVHDLRIELAPAEPSSVSASFVNEHGGHKLVKIFCEEYQAGDDRFDDTIYIRDEHRPATQELLARKSAREAILQLVANNGKVRVDAGSIVFEVREHGSIDIPAYVRAALALSRHVTDVG